VRGYGVVKIASIKAVQVKRQSLRTEF
jgi:hypothetical protein